MVQSIIKEDTIKLIDLANILNQSIDEIGFSFNGSRPGVRNRIILELLYKIRSNLSGIIVNLNYWPEGNQFQAPISLLYRTVVTDSATILYLLTFYDHERSFINEALVLDRKFVKAVEKLIDNMHLEMPLAPFDTVKKEQELQRQRLYHNFNQDIFISGTYKLKSAKEIRSTSDLHLFLNTSNISRELGDTEMFEQISLHPQTHGYAQMYNLYRYFSQHQHFSPSGSVVSLFPPNVELREWVVATSHVWDLIYLPSELFSLNKVSQVLQDNNFDKFNSIR